MFTDEEIEEMLHDFLSSQKFHEFADQFNLKQVESDPAPPDIKQQRGEPGLTCIKCKDFYEYADTPNQPDGTFKCFPCRKGY